jgi:hypothetical protein
MRLPGESVEEVSRLEAALDELRESRVRLGIAEEALEAVRDTAHDDERAAIVDAALSRLREENTKPGGAD